MQLRDIGANRHLVFSARKAQIVTHLERGRSVSRRRAGVAAKTESAGHGERDPFRLKAVVEIFYTNIDTVEILVVSTGDPGPVSRKTKGVDHAWTDQPRMPESNRLGQAVPAGACRDERIIRVVERRICKVRCGDVPAEEGLAGTPLIIDAAHILPFIRRLPLAENHLPTRINRLGQP